MEPSLVIECIHGIGLILAANAFANLSAYNNPVVENVCAVLSASCVMAGLVQLGHAATRFH